MVMIDLTSDVQSSSYEEIIYGLSRNSSNALPPPISLIALNGYRRMILTDSNLEMVANKIESNTLVGAGGTSSLLQTTNEYGGSINFPMSYNSHVSVLPAVMNRAEIVLSQTVLTADVPAADFNSMIFSSVPQGFASSFSTLVGAYVSIYVNDSTAGTSSRIALVKVSGATVASNQLTLSFSIPVSGTDAVGAGTTSYEFRINSFRHGVDNTYMYLSRRLGLNSYFNLANGLINSFELTFSPDSAVTGTMEVLASLGSNTATRLLPENVDIQNDVFLPTNTNENFGPLRMRMMAAGAVNGTLLNVENSLRSMTLSINNNVIQQQVVNSINPSLGTRGRKQVTGTIVIEGRDMDAIRDAYFANSQLELSFDITNGRGIMRVTLYGVQLSGGSESTGGDESTTHTYQFNANSINETSTPIQIDISHPTT